MFGLISKKKLIKEAVEIYMENRSDNAWGKDEQLKLNDFYYRCGNANALNGLCSRLGIDLLECVKEKINGWDNPV